MGTGGLRCAVVVGTAILASACSPSPSPPPFPAPSPTSSGPGPAGPTQTSTTPTSASPTSSSAVPSSTSATSSTPSPTASGPSTTTSPSPSSTTDPLGGRETEAQLERVHLDAPKSQVQAPSPVRVVHAGQKVTFTAELIHPQRNSPPEVVDLQARVECPFFTDETYPVHTTVTVPPVDSDDPRKIMATWTASLTIPKECLPDPRPTAPTLDGWISVTIAAQGQESWGAMSAYFTVEP